MAISRSVTRENLWFLSAQAHHQAGRLDQALDAYREVLRAQPTHGEALTGLCQVLGALGRSDEAVPFLDRAIDPENELSSLDIAWRCFELGQIDEAIALFQDAESNFPERAHTAIATTIPGSPSNSNREILNARRSWALQCVPPGLGSVRNQARREGAPLRIGYLSSFFQHHNWMKPVWGLINRHNRALVQVNLFSDAPKDQNSVRLQTASGGPLFRHQPPFERGGGVEMERSGIDILVDMNRFSKADRLPLLGLRPAPVTVEWFNMYATSGISSVDYLIGDSVVIPPEEEKILFRTNSPARRLLSKLRIRLSRATRRRLRHVAQEVVSRSAVWLRSTKSPGTWRPHGVEVDSTSNPREHIISEKLGPRRIGRSRIFAGAVSRLEHPLPDD